MTRCLRTKRHISFHTDTYTSNAHRNACIFKEKAAAFRQAAPSVQKDFYRKIQLAMRVTASNTAPRNACLATRKSLRKMHDSRPLLTELGTSTASSARLTSIYRHVRAKATACTSCFRSRKLINILRSLPRLSSVSSGARVSKPPRMLSHRETCRKTSSPCFSS